MKKKRDSVVDVSGYDTDERGRVINTDVPEEARKGTKTKKRKDTKKERLAQLEEDDTPKKKRKKRTDNLPVKVTKPDKPASDKALAKLARRREKVEAEIITITAKSGDEYDAQYASMFDNLRHITSVFEGRMSENPSSRDVYALSTLYSQMREVISDIRSSKDVEEQIRNLESQAYSAFLTLVGQTYVDLFFKLQKEIRSSVENPDVQHHLISILQGVCKDQGDNIQAGYNKMLDRVRQVLM